MWHMTLTHLVFVNAAQDNKSKMKISKTVQHNLPVHNMQFAGKFPTGFPRIQNKPLCRKFFAIITDVSPM
jgi:hypothetical protein